MKLNKVNMVYLGRRFFEVHNLKDNLNRNKKNVMISNFSVLATFFFVVLSGVSAFGEAKDPNAAEVLSNYRESLSYLQSVSMKVDMDVETKNDLDPNQEFSHHHEAHFILRHDRGRAEWIGELLGFDHQGNVDPNKSFVINEVITGECCLNVIALVNNIPILATISGDCEERQKELLDDPEYGGVLFGKIYGSSHKGIAELLGQSANLRLRDGQENINGIPCYVLEGTTEHGKVTAWIAPDKGYSALKWSIHKTGDDLFNDRPISSNSWLAVFDSVELQKVDDVFVTKGAALTFTIVYSDGRTVVDHYKYKTSDIQLHPDFEALGAFVFNLQDGTRVLMQEHPGISYIWQNGKIVPADEPTFDEIDKMVEELEKEKQ